MCVETAIPIGMAQSVEKPENAVWGDSPASFGRGAGSRLWSADPRKKSFSASWAFCIVQNALLINTFLAPVLGIQLYQKTL